MAIKKVLRSLPAKRQMIQKIYAKFFATKFFAMISLRRIMVEKLRQHIKDFREMLDFA